MRHVCLTEARRNARLNLECAECFAVWARGISAGTLGSALSIGIGFLLATEQNNIIDPMIVPCCEILVTIGLGSLFALWPISQAVETFKTEEMIAAQMAAVAERQMLLRIKERYLHGGRERLRSGKKTWAPERAQVAA